MKISPLAGKPAENSVLINTKTLIEAYYNEIPNPLVKEELVEFGTSGHRGSSLNKTFNERHILAIAQAICLYRTEQKITGPLFIGLDTHALSVPALQSVVEVLAANGVTFVLSENDEYTPTPAISHAIITHNKIGHKNRADGIIITPSHNPPGDGGLKYNPPNGGPAYPIITQWIQKKANELLKNDLKEVQRIPFEKALTSKILHRKNYLESYVNDLVHVIDMDVIRKSSINLGVDPLGGAGVHYWKAIKKRYELNLTIINETLDPTFKFMSLDWDGKIRMDPSSCFAMTGLIELKDQFDVAFACDTDYDRHGIVTKSMGLMPSNHYLAVAVYYLFQNRPQWNSQAGVGKTLVSSQIIDKITKKFNRKLYEVPVGFKWFVDGLLDSSLAFACEESAGASFSRLDGTVWTTDKDGIILALLAAEITAKLHKDPGLIYKGLTLELGTPAYAKVEANLNAEQKQKLKNLAAKDVHFKELGGEKILSVMTRAEGNGAPIDGIKVTASNCWFAARPSGTEPIYKIYAESFLGEAHLKRVLSEAESLVNSTLEKTK